MSNDALSQFTRLCGEQIRGNDALMKQLVQLLNGYDERLQALEARTRKLESENEALRRQLHNQPSESSASASGLAAVPQTPRTRQVGGVILSAQHQLDGMAVPSNPQPPVTPPVMQPAIQPVMQPVMQPVTPARMPTPAAWRRIQRYYEEGRPDQAIQQFQPESLLVPKENQLDRRNQAEARIKLSPVAQEARAHYFAYRMSENLFAVVPNLLISFNQPLIQVTGLDLLYDFQSGSRPEIKKILSPAYMKRFDDQWELVEKGELSF